MEAVGQGLLFLDESLSTRRAQGGVSDRHVCVAWKRVGRYGGDGFYESHLYCLAVVHFVTIKELVEDRIEGWWVGVVIVSNGLKGIWLDLVGMVLVELHLQ